MSLTVPNVKSGFISSTEIHPIETQYIEKPAISGTQPNKEIKDEFLSGKDPKVKDFLDKIKEKLDTPYYSISYDSKKDSLIISRPKEDNYQKYKEGYPFVEYDDKKSNPYTLGYIKKILLIKDGEISNANRGNSNLYNITSPQDESCDNLDFRFLKPGTKIEIPISIINTEKQYGIFEGTRNKELKTLIEDFKKPA